LFLIKSLLSYSPSYGSSQAKNFKDAAAHTQGLASLAAAAVEQMHAVRQHRRVAYGLRFLRLL
jgi:hypothetical protein